MIVSLRSCLVIIHLRRDQEKTTCQIIKKKKNPKRIGTDGFFDRRLPAVK